MANKTIMNIILFCGLLFTLSACSTHVVERIYMEGVESRDWKKGQNNYSVVYQCNNLILEYPRMDLGRRNATNSVLWIAAIPTSEVNKRENDKVYAWLSYGGIKSCDEIKVSMRLDGKDYDPEKTEGNARACRYGWGLKFKDIVKFNLYFSPINDCNIPSLEIKKNYDYSYENHFTPW